MKSFVSQGKTIVEAINNALITANFPQNFSIKILELGISSFFWWKNKSAVILFFYEIVDVSIENKRKLKKNSNKEYAFHDKKILNNLDDAQYTSVLKSEKNNYSIENNKNSVNKKNKINILENEINKNTIFDNKKNIHNEPQSFLGAALQNKINNQKKDIIINNKNNIINDKIIKNNDLEEVIIVKNWQSDHVSFVQGWIKELNKNLRITDDPIKISTDKEVLLIKMENIYECDFISKKYLFSSIVIILYEHLKAYSIEFDNKYFKIVIE